MMDRVSDERLSELADRASEDFAGGGHDWGHMDAEEALFLLRELQFRRAVEREQVASTEPRLAKWERQLREMGGSLRYNAESGEWEVWLCSLRGDVVDRVDFGKTPRDAVKAAHKAFKEARNER